MAANGRVRPEGNIALNTHVGRMLLTAYFLGLACEYHVGQTECWKGLSIFARYIYMIFTRRVAFN